MERSLYQIDAFASKLFEGNPAAVCPLDQWLSDEVMQNIATENNLSETAFFVPQGDGFHIRYAGTPHWRRLMFCLIFSTMKTAGLSLTLDPAY